MQQKRDDIDEIIMNSFIEVDVKEDYNSRLVSKMNIQKSHAEQKRQKNIAAVSFIMAGLMLMFIYTSDIKYKVTNLEFQMKTSVSTIRYNLSADKYFIGE